MKHISTYYHTLKYLKPIQIKYQLLYRLFKAKPLSHYKNSINPLETTPLKFIQSPYHYSSYLGNNKFTFLNQEKDFNQQIDWSYKEYGALWNYNLQYFNYLAQEDITKDEKLSLLKDFYQSNVVLEPYPISLRSINTIRFILREEIQDSSLIENLYGELNFLSQRLEFHILGNHLLENLFALMMGGVFFQEEKWIQKAHALLIEQLDEQILNDGAHFELSPMYHQIILNRVLELIDWYATYEKKEKQFEHFLREKAAKMLAWLKNMTFSNGEIPMVNDAAKGIAPTSKELFEYAAKLEIKPKELSLTDSGYIKWKTLNWELLMDYGEVGPTYLPGGHAQNDIFNILLNVDNRPVLVDTGTSVYENDLNRRNIERSTSSHNTVQIGLLEQNEMWSGFRMARRAKVVILNNKGGYIEGYHTGFFFTNKPIHQRKIKVEQNIISINDRILYNKGLKSYSYLHFHPSIKLSKNNNSEVVFDFGSINFINAESTEIEFYNYAIEFGKTQQALRIKIKFQDILETYINLKKESIEN
ncbi:MAG: alginate lyase family protein [Brumimicrobium sp.]|nr:alginate lyase family protein [Brumimicrobium sp.]